MLHTVFFCQYQSEMKGCGGKMSVGAKCLQGPNVWWPKRVQLSMGTKCPWGPNVYGDQMSVGTKCPWGPNFRGDQKSVDQTLYQIQRSPKIFFHHILHRFGDFLPPLDGKKSVGNCFSYWRNYLWWKPKQKRMFFQNIVITVKHHMWEICRNLNVYLLEV